MDSARPALLQSSQPRLRIVDLYLVAGRSKRQEALERGPRLVLLAELLFDDPEVVGDTRVARIHLHRLTERRVRLRPLRPFGDRHPHVVAEAALVGIAVPGPLPPSDPPRPP